jgi:hypothetical protein
VERRKIERSPCVGRGRGRERERKKTGGDLTQGDKAKTPSLRIEQVGPRERREKEREREGSAGRLDPRHPGGLSARPGGLSARCSRPAADMYQVRSAG